MSSIRSSRDTGFFNIPFAPDFTKSSISQSVMEDAVNIMIFSDFITSSFFNRARTSNPLNSGIAISSKITLYLPLSLRISSNPSFPSLIILHSISGSSKPYDIASVRSLLSSITRTFKLFHHS
jgi:hypothetical protein